MGVVQLSDDVMRVNTYSYPIANSAQRTGVRNAAHKLVYEVDIGGPVMILAIVGLKYPAELVGRRPSRD